MAEKGYSKRKDSWICPICLDVFTRPRSLPCLHTFCTNCLRGHIMNVGSQSLLSLFNCPVCRAQAKPPRPFTARETWAEQFPINHWLVSMMDEEQLSDDLEIHETKNGCDVHPDLTIKLFCLDHQALCCPMCVATDHRRCDEVWEITEILDDWNVVKETDVVQRTLTVTKNYVHELKKARHEQKLAALGNKAAIIRKIVDEKEKLVRHFDKLSDVLFESVETKYSEINKCIQDDLNSCVDTDKIVDESNALIAKIEPDPSAKVNAFILISQVQSKCRNMVETICKTKITVENETAIDCCINEKVLNIETLVPSFGELVNVHGEGAELETDLDATVTRGDSLSLSMETTEPIRDIGIPGDDDDEDGSFEIVNTADVESDSVWYLHDTQELEPRGSALSGDNALNAGSHFQLSANAQLQLVKVQIVVTTVDENPCWVTSACIMQNNCMIVCDRKNTNLKLFKAGRLLCEDLNSSSPWCVARVTGTLVAITYPQESLVRLFDLRISDFFIKLSSTFPVLGSVMKSERSFPVYAPCFGITCLRGVLIITCEECLKVFSLKGKLLQMISKDSSEQALFTRATFITVDDVRSTCYVSDEGKNSVMSFGMTYKTLIPLPQFVYTHTDLKCPQGLAVDAMSDIFICGFGSMNIHQISKEGQLRRVITTTTNRPWNVAMSPSRRLLCFSCYPENEQCKCVYFYEQTGS